MNLRTRIARWLAPDMARDADKYWYLWHQLDDAHKWLTEFGTVWKVLSWLKYNEWDHWRSIGTPASNPWPSRIDNFREYLRKETKQ